MTANPHLIPILDHWLTQKKPGFAIMVTAPWGAGKSFAIKGWLKDKRSDKDYVYVSLFGMSSPADIEEALFSALLNKSDIKIDPGFSEAAEGIIKKLSGAKIDLTGFHRRNVLKSLPKLIIFDDLERAQMPAPQLLSVLNRYVEHQGKSVLLIANEAELDSTPAPPKGEDTDPKAPKSDYRRWREKVVGRTITLTPETDAALTAFLDALPEGEGKTLLTAQRPLIRDVFDLSKTDNLRLLRQSLTDLCHFLDRLPETYRTQTKVLPGLMGDFLALSIAWHAGDRLDEADFDFFSLVRGSVRRMAMSAIGTPESPTGLQTLVKRFKGFPHVHLNGRVLPGKLAFSQIGQGHASDEVITSFMRQADAFQQSIDQTWRKLYFWWSIPEQEVEVAFLTLDQEIDAKIFTEPTTILHVFSIQIHLAREGLFGLEPAKIVERAKCYISDMANSAKLKMYQPESLGSSWMTHDHADGQGYAERDSDEVEQIRFSLHEAMAGMERALLPTRLEEVLDKLANDPGWYTNAFWRGGNRSLGIPDMTQTQVFQNSDTTMVAGRVFALAPDRWRAFLEPFKHRVEEQESPRKRDASVCPSERDWLIAFRNAALTLGTTFSPIKRAQMLHALQHLSFLDTHTPPDPKP